MLFIVLTQLLEGCKGTGLERLVYPETTDEDGEMTFNFANKNLRKYGTVTVVLLF